MEKQEQEELMDFLRKEGYAELVFIPGKGICGLRAFLYTIGLCHGLDKDGFSGRYCYPRQHALDAVIALKLWDGTDHPIGNWVKYKGRVEFGPDEKDQYKL